MTTECSIVRDLLPLYNEGLVRLETAEWIEAHLEDCPICKSLAKKSADPVPVEAINSPIDHEKMMSKVTMKLSIYQLIFVGMSFFLAMQTTVLNDSYGFILSYTVLGLIMYLFYRSLPIITLVAFVPIFIWSLITLIPDILSSSASFLETLGALFTEGMFSSFVLASLHLVFALIGTAIGVLILKLKEGEG